MTKIYPYFPETLKLKDRLGKMRLKLEENFRSIKSVALAPVGISICEIY